MGQIVYATMEDIAEIKALMDSAVTDFARKDWYVTDDEAFISRHIGGEQPTMPREQGVKPEGYILKCIVDGKMAAFLIVRHPGDAEDNLGVYLPESEQVNLQLISHMESAAVHPAYRGQGLQGKLLQEAEEIERTRGTKYLMATVHPENIYSLRNLEKEGYKCILETKKYGGLRRKVLCKELHL